MKEDKVNSLVKELLMKMLGDNYDDVMFKAKEAKEKGERYAFYDDYTWTKEEQDEFMKWASERVKKVLRVNKKRADKEVSYFILTYGLKVAQ